jgi:hypothetical protein
MKYVFDANDVRNALGKFHRLRPEAITIDGACPAVIATADAAEKPKRTGRLRGKSAAAADKDGE